VETTLTGFNKPWWNTLNLTPRITPSAVLTVLNISITGYPVRRDITNGDEDMADTWEDWEHAKGDDPTLDLDLDEYDQFLLDNLELGKELPKAEGTESKEQPECYMNLQDPEPPREAPKKLTLESTTVPSGDVTISDTPYETSDKACLRLLH
jgi:hypothetical protein